MDLQVGFLDVCTAHWSVGGTLRGLCWCAVLVAAVAMCRLPVSGVVAGIDEGNDAEAGKEHFLGIAPS